ncbi:MAG: hypothetical protein K2Y21_03255 [Phycisphaerales bacterium]|nr:hypothetical protein [Phycisphaerales bacterium]
MLDERQFYWTLIDLPSPLRGDPNAPGARLSLDDAFQRSVPEDLETLAARYVTVSEREVVGCAIARERVQAVLDSDAGVVVLRPKEVPEALRPQLDGRGMTSRVLWELNFLVDEFEALPVARLRQSVRRCVTAGLAGLLLLTAGGLWLRADAETQEAARLTALAAAMLREVSPGRPPDETLAQGAARLHKELELLLRSRGADAVRVRPRDAGEALAALLAAWPPEIETRVASLQVQEAQITLNVEVPSIAAAEGLASALAGVAGWTLRPPQTEVAGGAARVMATFTPVAPPERERREGGRL